MLIVSFFRPDCDYIPDASDESKVTANTTAKEIKRDSSVENDGMGKREKRRKKSEPGKSQLINNE